jgi:hypothetical protein
MIHIQNRLAEDQIPVYHAFKDVGLQTVVSFADCDPGEEKCALARYRQEEEEDILY